MATTLSKLDRDTAIHVEHVSTPSSDLHVCAECRYAQLFAVQPRAVCTRLGNASEGKVTFAGQPACADMEPRGDHDLSLSSYAFGVEMTRLLFVRTPARIH